MAAAYTKDFLVAALCHKYESVLQNKDAYLVMAEYYYDKVGKDQFRVSASLDADTVKKYKLELKAKV